MNISSALGKLSVGGIRISGFIAGAHAAARLGECGLRVIDMFVPDSWLQSDATLGKVTGWLKDNGLDIRQRDPNNPTQLKDNKLLLKEIFVLTVASLALTEFCFWCESKPPKIYNMVLSLFTPIRVSEQSMVTTFKEFDWADAFKA